MNFIEQDPNFKIINYIINSKIDNPQEITIRLGTFRKNLNFYWINLIPKTEQPKFLSIIIKTLLICTNNEHPNVRVTAYSTLCALLITITPFNPKIIIHSFGSAINKFEISSRSSIAIINMFVYICQYISPINLQSFLIITPIQEHFKANFSDFLKYLPQLIPLMNRIPIYFHFILMDNLLLNCQKTLNNSFINSIYSLICLNKKEMIQYLIKYLGLKEYNLFFLSLGSLILIDEEIIKLLNFKSLEYFLEISIEYLTKIPLQFIEFESSCILCNLLLKIYKNHLNYLLIKNKILNSIPKNLPIHFQRLTLLLQSSFEEIISFKDNSDSFTSSKLFALANFYNENFQNLNSDEVVLIFLNYIDSNNDLYCSLIESFTLIIDNLFKYCKKNYHINLLKLILNKENQNWVHDLTLVNLISKINVLICEKYFENYFKIIIKKLLNFSISPTTKLSDISINTICKITSYSNLDLVLTSIIKYNWVDENITYHLFILLSKLIELFDLNKFLLFNKIAFECLLLHDSLITINSIFLFLSKSKLDYVPNEIIELCYIILINSFESFTHIIFPKSNFSEKTYELSF